MDICRFCTAEILVSNIEWNEHHASLEDLRKSEQDGCIFCKRLLQDWEDQKSNNNGGKNQWPMYRWNIKSLSATRSSKKAVVVTFRQILRERDVGDGDGDGPGEQQAAATMVETNILPDRAFYLFSEKDLGNLPTTEQLGHSTDPSKSKGKQIQEWVRTCDSTHKYCRRKAKFVPTRLLDISCPAEAPIKVIETRSTKIDVPYASLSHCWGRFIFVQLKTSNRETFMKDGVPWDELPTNFKQAIDVARFLGVKYIWIDSLCIIQGKDGDFQNEAGLMHQVYRNSYCNIAIADSEDSRGGAFRPRKPEQVMPVRHDARGTNAMLGKGSWIVVAADMWESELLETPLYRRGWVFQERMLAPRILHFARHQIFWDCPSLSACETLPGGLPQPMDDTAGPDRHWRARLQEQGNLADAPLAGPNDDSLEHFWITAVEKYTSCNLTKGSDKSIAIWGIAKLVRDGLEQEYALGMWQDDLAKQLAWKVAECKDEERGNESKNEDKFREIPSWSWASMDGKIEAQDPAPNDHFYVVKDHHRRSLQFDLPPTRPGLAPRKSSEEAWNNMKRFNSDSVIELRKALPEPRRSRDPELLHSETTDRDKEPKPRSADISIQGHIGRGTLRWDGPRKKWLLAVRAINNLEIECFPDTMPKQGNFEEMNPYFVVLCASRDTNLRMDPFKVDKEFEYSGLGILMKKAGYHRYRRTGAMKFRSVNQDQWNGLQTTRGKDEMASHEFDEEHGIKFWLE